MSNPSTQTLTVTIMQKEFQISCPAGEEDALRRAAHHLNEQMESIRAGGKVVGLDRIAIMTALNMSNELLNGQSKVQTSQDYARLRIRALKDRVEAAIADGKQLKI
ncbi:MAG: cell division protein ZapA [Gammaproteobacteria bacterium]|jgi:cell division protein ZapA